MTNTTMFHKLINDYNAISYTHNYIYGFEYKGNVYKAVTDSAVMPYVLTLDKGSRGSGYALRFCPKTAQKLFLMTSAQVLCSAEYFEELVSESKYNRGEIFEKLVTESYGQVWTKDNVPFTEAGDIEVDGIAYQIKYQKATFCNEKSLANLTK